MLSRRISPPALVLAFAMAAACVVLLAGHQADEATSEPRAGWESYGSLPIAFEHNEGQTDRRVDFVARAGSATRSG